MNYREAVETKRKAMVDQLLAFIESNPTAWEAGWYKVGGAPRNGKTGKNYNGLNALWLYLLAEHKGYADPRWVTYQQAKDLKASVKAGEKSSNVFYWSWYDKKTKKPFDEETVKDMSKDERQKYLDENVRPVLKYYQVFNASQCNNFPKLDAEQQEMPADERARQNAKIESIITNSAAPVYYDGGNRAYYSPRQDSIHLPEINRFHSMQDYYATALHEIAHSTGHASRLNREMISIFGTSDYAKEELRAELASVFMQLDYDISVEGKHFENHAAYLQSWLKSVRDDQKEFFAAVTDAEKISQYVGEHYLQAQADIVAEAEKENTKEKIKADETSERVADDVYGLLYNWKGLKEEYAIEQRQKKIDKIVYDIVNEGTENTTQGNWIINFDQFGEDETFVRENIEDIVEALNKREEVADVIIDENGIDTNYYTNYCPNLDEKIGDEENNVEQPPIDNEVGEQEQSEQYVLNFQLNYGNKMFLDNQLKELGYTSDPTAYARNQKRDAAAREVGLELWTNEIRYTGADDKEINGVYFRESKFGGILVEATDITRFTTNGLTQDEAKQIADVVRGFGVEVDMQSVQPKEELEQAQPVEQAEQAEQVGQARQGEWYSIDLTPEQIGNEYGNNVMIHMPQGEYSSFVFFAPKKLLHGGKDGTKKLSVRADWSYKLQNDGLQVELNGSELRAAYAGKEVGKSAKRVAPRKRNRKRLDDLEANVPDAMKSLKNWCVFRTKYNPETERQDKFVISPTDGKWAKTNDPDTWVDFETAIKYAEENDCAGLSFALDGKCGITCIDLDKSISKDGKLTESAEKLTQELAETYTETSVSGNGIHIFVADDILRKTYKNRADLPDGEIEVYDSGRFISMTGNMRSKSNALSNCPTATMTWLHGTLGKKIAARENKPRGGVGQSDNDVIERIRRSKRGHDFDTLMSGGAITGDKSRDDMILLNMLAFFTDCDRAQMESIFLSSGRRADLGANGGKKSSNYLSRSIEKACSSLKTRISPAAIGGAGRAGTRNR